MYRMFLAIGSVAALTAAAAVRSDIAHFVFPTGITTSRVTETVGPPPTHLAPPDVARDAPAINQATATFDVVKISPDGASVFAGRAAPNSNVTITANGQEVATARADATGAWAAVMQREFEPAEYEFGLHAQPSEGGKVTAGQSIQMAIAPTGRSRGWSPMPKAIVQASPAPITFVFNETMFTDAGQQAAARLAQHLLAQRFEGRFPERPCGRTWFR